MRRMIAAMAIAIAFVLPAAAQSFPVTVEHALGETTIPAAPQRVVSLGYVDQDYLYALGIAPVAVRERFGGFPYATWPWAEAKRAELGATPAVHPDGDINLEWILAQQPDLIVAVYEALDADKYAALSRIAPVIANVKGQPQWGAPWQDNLKLIDSAVHGNTTSADAIIAGIEAEIAAARAAYPQLEGKTATTAYYWSEIGITLWASTDTVNRFLQSFGLIQPPGLDDRADGDGRIVVSPENMNIVDADVVVWPIDDPAAGTQAQVEALPLTKNLRITREGRSLWLDDGKGIAAGALSFMTPLSILYLIDILPPALAAAVDGDLATTPALPPAP